MLFVLLFFLFFINDAAFYFTLLNVLYLLRSLCTLFVLFDGV